GLGWTVQRANVQRDAVAAIERAGGHVYYDWQCDPNGMPLPVASASEDASASVLGAPPHWPSALVKGLGVDYFGHVVTVDMESRGSDAVLAHVGTLGRLEHLSLTASRLSDARLAHLGQLSHLQELTLGGTGITDAGLVHLKGLTVSRCWPSRIPASPMPG